MAQSWFKRNFGWIADDIRRGIDQMKRPETWVIIGMLFLFGIVAYFGFQLVKNTDSMMKSMKYTTRVCRDLTNGPIIFLFTSIFFFFLSVFVTFGEVAQHLNFKRRNALYQAKSSLYRAIGWGGFALVLAAAVIIYVDSMCF